jgi:hypothetical protein
MFTTTLFFLFQKMNYKIMCKHNNNSFKVT